MATFLKSVESSISTMRENTTAKVLTGADVVFTLGDRTDVYSKEGNYFSSFNLPYAQNQMASGSTISLERPEIFQLNVDQAVFVQISRNNYSEYIDGRSITFEVPQIGGTSIKVVSAFFSEPNGIIRTNDDSVLGENISFLFCDEINTPLSGTSEGGVVHRETLETWDPTTDFRDRPNAVAYSDMSQNDINTDSRAWSAVNTAVSIDMNYPNPLDVGYNYDIPVGFASLDKGYLILTHPDIINNIPWTSGSTIQVGGNADSNAGESVITGSNAGAGSGTTNIAFTSVTSSLEYQDVSTSFSTSIVCIAMPSEFFISTNPSWDRARNLSEVENETFNLDSIYVTQVGLYNAEHDLIAVAKVDRPIEKTYTNILTFNLNLEV